MPDINVRIEEPAPIFMSIGETEPINIQIIEAEPINVVILSVISSSSTYILAFQQSMPEIIFIGFNTFKLL